MYAKRWKWKERERQRKKDSIQYNLSNECNYVAYVMKNESTKWKIEPFGFPVSKRSHSFSIRTTVLIIRYNIYIHTLHIYVKETLYFTIEKRTIKIEKMYNVFAAMLDHIVRVFFAFGAKIIINTHRHPKKAWLKDFFFVVVEIEWETEISRTQKPHYPH